MSPLKRPAKRFSRILLPLDGSGLAEQILPLVEWAAAGFGSSVELLQIVQAKSIAEEAAWRGSKIKEVEADTIQKAGRYLSELSRNIRIDPKKVSRQVVIGDIPEAILASAGPTDSSLIAMSTHGRSGVRRFLLGSVAGKILNASNNPILLYSPIEDNKSRGKLQIRNLIVPLDGSELAEAVLPYVHDFAKALNLNVILLRVVEPPYSYMDYSEYSSMPVDFEKEKLDEAKVYLEQKASRLGQLGLKEAMVSFVVGKAADEIIDLAKNTPSSMIAISTHGRSGLGRWALGSVADKVVRSADVPVLIVRSKNS